MTFAGDSSRRQAERVPVVDRAAGRLDHLQRTGDAGAVARLQPFAHHRITPRKLAVQGLDSVAHEPRAHGLADVRGHGRHVGKPAQQRLEVEAGAADEDRQPVQRASLDKCGSRILEPGADGTVHRGVAMAVQPVRNARLVVRRRPRGNDAQIAINLHGIRIDDDAAASFGQCQRERRLAAGRRPCDKHRPARIGRGLCLSRLLNGHVIRRNAHLQSGHARAR